MSDISKIKVAELNRGLILYHVVNKAGVEYSTIEDKKGEEWYSCERYQEATMLRRFRLNKKIRDTYGG